MGKKKLVVFHPALAPYRVDFFNALNENFDAVFYFFNENLLNQKFEQDRLKQKLNFQPLFLNSGLNLSGRTFRFGVRRIVKKIQPDVIICPEFNPINLFVILIRCLSRKKYKIYTLCDDNMLLAKDANFVKKIFRFALLRWLDGIIFTHQEIAEWYKEQFHPKGALLVFPIIRKEKPYTDQLQKSLSIARQYIAEYKLTGKKVLLFVGRLVKVKNLERLIDAFRIVHDKQEETLLVLVGSGGLENTLKKKVNDLGLNEHVVFPGRFEGEALSAWYLCAGIFILPSISETFGAVINEALLSGCYVLASKIAGGSSLIEDNINGNTFNPYDTQEIAKAITHIIDDEKLFNDQGELKKSRMSINFEEHFQHIITQVGKA